MKKFLMSVALFSAIATAAGYSMIGSDESEVNVVDCPDYFSWGKTAKLIEPNE